MLSTSTHFSSFGFVLFCPNLEPALYSIIGAYLGGNETMPPKNNIPPSEEQKVTRNMSTQIEYRPETE